MLSGIGKIYNWKKYAFPLKLSIESVLDGADEFVLVVCTDSQDNTVEYCQALEKAFARKLKLVYSKWIENPAEGKFTMRRLADLAINQAQYDWFISVDMDEVYRPGEMKKLRDELNKLPLEVGGVAINFIHHYIDIRHRIFGKLYDRSVRVGRKSLNWKSYDDGFGITGDGVVVFSPITCNHYGFVRPAKIGLEKELNFQQTLYAPLDSMFPDPRLLELDKQKENLSNHDFYNTMMGDKDFIVSYNGNHWPGVEDWYKRMEDA